MSVLSLSAAPALVAGARLGEGPVWDDRVNRLLWVDILRREFHQFDPVSGTDSHVVLPSEPGAVVACESGGHLCAVREGFALLSETGGYELIVDRRRPGVRLNDGTCAPDGSFWAGSMADTAQPGAGVLYRLDPDGTLDEALAGLTISNGIDFTRDGAAMYYIDTPTLRVDRYDTEPGTAALRNRRTVVEFPDGAGRPDGLTLDADGGLWVALFRGGEVHRYTPDGVLDVRIELPVQLPTSCAFGGPDYATLFITTATPATGSAHPLDGSVFAVVPGVAGLPPVRYQGGGQAWSGR